MRQWKKIGLSAALSRLCEVVGRVKMFCVSFGSFLSIMLGVQGTKAFTLKFLRNKGDRSDAAMTG